MKLLKRHWRVFIPILLMGVIFWFSSANSTLSDAQSEAVSEAIGVSDPITRKIAHILLFASLGASWVYYLRTLGRFTPGFTVFGAFMITAIYAVLDELHQTFVPGRAGLMTDVLIDSGAAVIGVALFSSIYYATRSPEAKKARKKQVEEIWRENEKTMKKLGAKKKKTPAE